MLCYYQINPQGRSIKNLGFLNSPIKGYQNGLYEKNLVKIESKVLYPLRY